MCPEKHILSAYYDGELDEKYSIIVEAHVAGCDQCRLDLEAFGSIRSALLRDVEPDLIDRQRGSWQLLRKRLAYAVPLPVWRRKFQVPLPVFAAMALAVLFLSIGLVLSLIPGNDYNAFDNVTRTDLSSTELKSVDDILNYLDARGESYTITFELPQNTKLQITSEPALIRAADYNRGR